MCSFCITPGLILIYPSRDMLLFIGTIGAIFWSVTWRGSCIQLLIFVTSYWRSPSSYNHLYSSFLSPQPSPLYSYPIVSNFTIYNSMNVAYRWSLPLPTKYHKLRSWSSVPTTHLSYFFPTKLLICHSLPPWIPRIISSTFSCYLSITHLPQLNPRPFSLDVLHQEPTQSPVAGVTLFPWLYAVLSELPHWIWLPQRILSRSLSAHCRSCFSNNSGTFRVAVYSLINTRLTRFTIFR